MNPTLIQKMPKEIQVLWQISKKKALNKEFDRLVRQYIQNNRAIVKYDNIDPLEVKYELFPKTGDWASVKIKELSSLLYEDKKPEEVDVGKWISVEIECVFTRKNAEGEFVSFVRKHGYNKNVTIKNDGSIHPDQVECEGHEEDEDGNELECDCPTDSYGKEIVVTFRYGEWDIIKAICQKLVKLSCIVNKTCGLHVHFDCRHLSPRQAGTLGKRVAQTIPALKQLLPHSRQENEYCRIDINKINPPTRDRSQGRYDRYAFVNMLAYNKHKTIEIRGHSGTLDYLKICNWIRLIHTIMAKRNTKPITTVTELINTFDLESDLVGYVVNRFDKFSQERAKPRRELSLDDVAADNESQLDPASFVMTEEQYNEMIARVNRLINPPTSETPQIAPSAVTSPVTWAPEGYFHTDTIREMQEAMRINMYNGISISWYNTTDSPPVDDEEEIA